VWLAFLSVKNLIIKERMINFRNLGLFMLMLSLLFSGLSLASQTTKAEIWLAPQGLPQSPSSNVDFMQMFQPNAPWTFTASQTKVFCSMAAPD